MFKFKRNLEQIINRPALRGRESLFLAKRTLNGIGESLKENSKAVTISDNVR